MQDPEFGPYRSVPIGVAMRYPALGLSQ
jgi:hypothetical protein